mgnify:CR=1 FL=1
MILPPGVTARVVKQLSLAEKLDLYSQGLSKSRREKVRQYTAGPSLRPLKGGAK